MSQPIRSASDERAARWLSKYAGSEVKLDGEEHMIIREEDVLGVIE